MVCKKRYFAALLPALVVLGGAPSARAQQTAPTPAPDAVPAASVPRLMVLKAEELKFTDPSKITLRTWHLQSENVAEVEVQVWYIANGVANPRGQKLIAWMQRKQSGTWRLYLLEQSGPSKAVLPTYGLEVQFDDDTAKPDMSASGVYGGSPLKPFRLPSALNSTAEITKTNAPGLLPNQPYLLYVAQTLNFPMPNDKTDKGLTAMGLVAKPEPNAIEILKKASKHPGTAFLVVTLTWKPAQMVAK